MWMFPLYRFCNIDGKVNIEVMKDPGKFQVGRCLNIIIKRGIKFLKVITKMLVTINAAGAARTSSCQASIARSMARNTNSCKFI